MTVPCTLDPYNSCIQRRNKFSFQMVHSFSVNSAQNSSASFTDRHTEINLLKAYLELSSEWNVRICKDSVRTNLNFGIVYIFQSKLFFSHDSRTIFWIKGSVVFQCLDLIGFKVITFIGTFHTPRCRAARLV